MERKPGYLGFMGSEVGGVDTSAHLTTLVPPRSPSMATEKVPLA